MPRPRPPVSRLGFTLVEIAIVLVIIGLLLGGVLKGQELINNAKVKALSTDLRSIPLFVYAYQDKFRAIPGDDPSAQAHVGAGATLSPSAETLGNGRIEGAFNSSASSDESLAFWQQIRLANLASGPSHFSTADAIKASVPRNMEGGRIGIQSASPIVGMTGSLFACSDAIPGKLAKQIDIAMDDGSTHTGSVRVTATGYNGVASAAVPMLAEGGVAGIDDETRYLVCAAF